MASFTADPLLFASCIREQSYINTGARLMGEHMDARVPGAQKLKKFDHAEE